jgi:hypothetical protein
VLHIRRKIPIVRVAADLSVCKLDDGGAVNLERLVGRWKVGEVFGLTTPPNPFHGAGFSVGCDETRFQFELQICERRKGPCRKVRLNRSPSRTHLRARARWCSSHDTRRPPHTRADHRLLVTCALDNLFMARRYLLRCNVA